MPKTLRNYEGYARHGEAPAGDLTQEQKIIVKFLIHNLARLQRAVFENDELQIKARLFGLDDRELAEAFMSSKNDKDILSWIKHKRCLRSFRRRIEKYFEAFVKQYDLEGSKYAPLFIDPDGERTKSEIIPPPMDD